VSGKSAKWSKHYIQGQAVTTLALVADVGEGIFSKEGVFQILCSFLLMHG
jgi:hypothetical protein